jgi:outer membrane protein assembly factor BamB
VGSFDGNLYALNLADGKELWKFTAGGDIAASPAIAGNRLLIGTRDGVLYCLRSKTP